MKEAHKLYMDDYLNCHRVIVAGGRDFNDYEFMCRSLDEIFGEAEAFCGKGIKIISGMAKGVDTLAIRYADEHKLTKILYPANWKLHPRIAGYLRNLDMLETATHLVAFWNGSSRGTKHMIEVAKEKQIPVFVIHY